VDYMIDANGDYINCSIRVGPGWVRRTENPDCRDFNLFKRKITGRVKLKPCCHPTRRFAVKHKP
jgi:hypothetical protein